MTPIDIAAADPCGEDALSLLRAAADEARQLYPESFEPGAPYPTNAPTPPRGTYLIARVERRALGMGAHRLLDDTTTELRRLYVVPAMRRTGVATRLVRALEQHAAQMGLRRVVLETGRRQLAAMRLYAALGYQPIEPYGPHVGDPLSVCYAKALPPA